MLHFLNYFILQWFFIRLASVHDTSWERVGWTVLRVWPLSGYNNSPMRYWGQGK